jgi:hypothetical protein
MLKYFSKVTHPGSQVKINPEMFNYLNEYTKKHIDNKKDYFALLTSGSDSDDPEKNNIKLIVFVGVISFLAGSYFHFIVS